MPRLPILRALLALSVIAQCRAQYQVGRIFNLSPDSSLVFLDNDGKIVHDFDHENEVITKFQDVNGVDTMMVAMPKNFTFTRLPEEKIDDAKLPDWYEKLRKRDIELRESQESTINDDDNESYFEMVYDNGRLVQETYSDKTMKISIISDRSTTEIDMTKGFDLRELQQKKKSLARYQSYDGQKKCRSNRYDRAIVRGLRAGKLSRPNMTDSGRFENPFPTWKQPSLLQTIDFFVRDRDESIVPYSDHDLDRMMPILNPNFKVSTSEYDHFRVTWIGHSTLLIQINGLNILTDPIFSDRASPTQYFGPKRFRRPACQIDELPKIDIVLISHNHFDHLDADSVTGLNDRFGRRVRWIVPLGLGSFLKFYSITNYIEMDWWQKDCHPLPPVDFISDLVVRQDPDMVPNEEQVNLLNKISKSATAFSARSAVQFIGSGFSENFTDGEVAIYFTPTQHGSRRGVIDYNRSLWGSFVIVSKNNATFFFSGDTGYCSAFDEIGVTFGPFAGAAIPIGAYKPRHFLRVNHINPQEAIQVHRELRSKKSIAIHHSTFSLSYEPFREPVKLLNRFMGELMTRNGVKEPFTSVKHGETVLFCTTCN